MFRAFPSTPIIVEFKDKDNQEAARLIISLIQKYKRHEITLCAIEHASSDIQGLLLIDPQLCTVADTTDVILILFSYWLGLLPFLHVDREAFFPPYMTRDHIRMKSIEKAARPTLLARGWDTFYIYFA